MRINYDEEADTLTVVLRDAPVAESDEDKPGVILDLRRRGESGVHRGTRRIHARGAPAIGHAHGVTGGSVNTVYHRDYQIREPVEMRLPVHERADWGGLLDTQQAGEQVSEQVSEQVPTRVRKLLSVLDGELHREELQGRVHIKSRPFFIKHFLARAFEAGLVEMTDPASPNSPQQPYRLTPLGRELRDTL